MNKQKFSGAELVTLLSVADRATRGSWKAVIEGVDHESGSTFIMTGVGGERGPDIEISGATDDDIRFIAACREIVPLLINEIQYWRARNDKAAP